jgi:hypothetical protein
MIYKPLQNARHREDKTLHSRQVNNCEKIPKTIKSAALRATLIAIKKTNTKPPMGFEPMNC